MPREISGEWRLVAYVVRKSGRPPQGEEVEAFLKRQLPAYMIPAACVFLEKFPLTPGGMLDYKALPAPNPEPSGSDNGYMAPRTSTEKALCDIWSELLGLKRVGIRDNFFKIGGHSLAATRLSSRLRDTFSVDLTLRSLLAYPTVENMATVIDNLLMEELDSASVNQILEEIESSPQAQESLRVKNGGPLHE
jgi:acyl carrier protein